MPRSRPAVGVAAAVFAVVLAFVSAGCGGSDPTTRTEAERSQPAAQGPVVVSLPRLSDLAHSVGHPVYWAGRRPGAYELTVDVNGNIFIRYLPAGVSAGSRRKTALTIATYPFADAYGTLRAASRRPGATADSTPDGGLVVAAEGDRNDVHIAYPERDIQIEVYDPHPGGALELATGGGIAPIP